MPATRTLDSCCRWYWKMEVNWWKEIIEKEMVETNIYTIKTRDSVEKTEDRDKTLNNFSNAQLMSVVEF